jgi:hypothetical protein
MIYSVQRPGPYVRRLDVVIDRTYGIQTYGVGGDNLYPQRADAAKWGSFTLRSGIEVTTDFIKGQGFEDVNLANLIFNSDGMTGNDVLDYIAQDKAPFIGFALHFKYNLNFRIAEITPVDFMYNRLGYPDDRGEVCEIKYNINWEQDYNKTLNRNTEPEIYPVFNPNPDVVRAQMEQYGGWANYPGQILYWTPKPGVYPKARFDAVFDHAQVQAEIGESHLYGIQNKFSAQHILKYPGTFESDDKKREIKQGVAEFQGARGTNSMMVIEDPSGEGKPLVESLQMQNTDKMYEFTAKDARNSIREALQIPAPLIGQMPEQGMFNQEQIRDSYDYMNIKTSGDRDQIARVFQKVMSFWKDQVGFASFKIKPLQYAGSGMAASTSGQPGTTQPGQAQAVARPEMNEQLSKLSGTQDAQLQRIIRQYDSGKLSYSRALQKMTMTFPITKEEATELLGPEDEI